MQLLASSRDFDDVATHHVYIDNFTLKATGRYNKFGFTQKPDNILIVCSLCGVLVHRACCYGNNVKPDKKNTHQLFHPRLHDGYMLRPLSTIQKRFINTVRINQTVEEEEELDDLYRLITIEVKGHDKAVLNSYTHFMQAAAAELEIKTKTSTPPTHFLRKTLNRAVFASKRAKVQYEIRTYYKEVQVFEITGSTSSVYLEYIQRNLPEGCAMKVTKHKLCQFPESVTAAWKTKSQVIDSIETSENSPTLISSENKDMDKVVSDGESTGQSSIGNDNISNQSDDAGKSNLDNVEDTKDK